MIIVLPTVPGTGSNFVLRDILKGYTKLQNERGHKGDGVVFSHIDPKSKVLELLKPFLEKYPAIVPLRHPLSCAKSWKSRRRPISEMMKYWENLIQNMDPYDPYYLPIDQDDRDEYLARINKSLGTDFKTDWPIINSSEDVIELNKRETTLVRDFISENSDFFDRFGYKCQID